MSRRAPGSTDRAGGGAADTAVSATPVPQQQIGPRRHIPGPSLLEVSALRVTYGGAPAVDGFSLTIAPGEIVGLIGPNGAGKSSVLNAVSGDVRPTAGSIRLAGRDVTRLPAHRRARLGMARTSQTARVFEGLTVFEGLVTFARRRGSVAHPDTAPPRTTFGGGGGLGARLAAARSPRLRTHRRPVRA